MRLPLAWICWMRDHNYRRARKGEDRAKKYCVRCLATKPIQKRTPKERA